MADLIELECFTVRGTAREMGRALGEALGARVKAFVAMRMGYFESYSAEYGAAFALDRLLAIGRESMAVAAGWDPVGHSEHLGIAEGAGVDAGLLYSATNMTDLRDVLLLGGEKQVRLPAADAEGCTAVLVPAGATVEGHAIAGQTWDLNLPDVDYIVAVHRLPSDGIETWSVTCTGCLSLMGMNARGVAVGTTNIKTWGAKPGVGYLSVLHRMIRAGSAAEAAAVAEMAPRAGAHTYWAADAVDQIEVEAAPGFSVRRDAKQGGICRTNHCLDPRLVAVQGEAPHVSSAARFKRVTQSLRDEGPHSVASVKAIFSDRRDGLQSVNRYPEDGDFAATNAVFVAVPAQRWAMACRGPADRGRWVSLGFETGGFEAGE